MLNPYAFRIAIVLAILFAVMQVALVEVMVQHETALIAAA